MAFDGRVVKTYGRLKQKTIKQDNWISPNLLAGRRKISNVFSSPDNDSNASSDAAAINVSEKENILPADVVESKKPQRKAAKKANAALEGYAKEDNDGNTDASKEKNSKGNKTGKDRQFSKLSRQYKKVKANSIEEEEEKDLDVLENNMKTGRILRGKVGVKAPNSSFDLIFNIAKEKKTSSSSDDATSPILNEEIVDGLTLGSGMVETSTPCEAHQRSLGQSLGNRGCITRRRAKRDVPFSPGSHGRRRAKRQRVVVPQILSFSDDDSFLFAPRRLRTRQHDQVAEVASRLSAIHLDESSVDDSYELCRTRECSVKLSRISNESIEELGHGSMDLFDDEDHDREQDLDQDPEQDQGADFKSGVRLRSCQVSLERISLSSGICSDAAEVSGDHESLCQSKNNHRRFPRERKDTMLDEPKSIKTPLVNKSISRLALDSFKVALTPTRNRKTGKLLSPKCKVLAQCDQEDFITFSACIPSAMMKKCVKIGEGVYGEVFRTTNSRKSVALKIIPVEGDFPVNEESQKPFEEILPEIVISWELSVLREGEDTMTTNFIGVNRVSCVKGSYPKKLLDEWDKYDDRKTSENDRPDIFPSDQLFIVFEFADGGKDLESFEFENIYQAVSVIRQVTGALAVAERELEFEHRDLHWGNVLVGDTKDDQVTFMLDGQVISVESHGLHISIIDFTLSRLQKDECTVFCDLAEDPTLFTGEGDKQFDVYRSMKEHNNNKWEGFQPKTNVFWIEYLLDKVIWEKKYPSDRSQRKVLGQLKTLVREIQEYSSAEDVLKNSDLLSIG
ncbi:uncharacterized protein LOC121425155 [Lytechinus variegatus]|uniref:uncharacterized protein LOC121425155 n=1 Tax=Lytechinus variegatus TaxID=7654 RepID=UPI001BB150F0|nr:uncharacterized protein LOC121425155 [Lytechinus variegatus]